MSRDNDWWAWGVIGLVFIATAAAVWVPRAYGWL
jgi:hypothetical protein